ncbi:hypothetical protein BWK58_14280 [Flavobacterium columnare]|nr:hypothetical protein BWK58_14280 [Flavobacterium columnare]
MTVQEKQTLKQFTTFCKNQIDIEDPRYQYSIGYTTLILNLLELKNPVIKKKDVKNKLDEVLVSKDLQNTFLSNIAKLSSYDKNNLYFIIRPNGNRYLSKVSSKDAEILTNYILNNYKYIEEAKKDTDRESKTEESIKYIRVEKEAVYKGGMMQMQEYIASNLNLPETVKTFSGKVLVRFVVLEDGSIDSIEIKQNIPNELKTEIERVFKNMPKWIPAKAGNENVKSWQVVPISF